MKRTTALFLCILLLCSTLSGCSSRGNNAVIDNTLTSGTGSGTTEKPTGNSNTSDSGLINLSGNLMEGIQPQTLTSAPVSLSGTNAAKVTDFAVQLFKASLSAGENTMISPVSVLYALSMTANGAKGNTLSQMEDVFGMSISECNTYLKAYMDALPNNEKYKLNIANSIWLTDDSRFSVKQNFLQTNADYYGADIFKVPFDTAALNNINAWVDKNTDGMIKNILNEIPPEAVMYLINAIAFDAEWAEIYKEYQIQDDIFTTETGKEQDVKMMHSEESLYLSDNNASGFIKYYADSKYAFAALLPKEGMSIRDYVDTLTGEKLSSLLSDPQSITVYASMPKFESEYEVEMSELLIGMGMKDAFNSVAADFSDLGISTDGNIFINRILHKTFITVDEKGTKAAAATVVEMVKETAMMPPEETKQVILDRPFVYMIIDCEAKLPLFIGTLSSVE